MANTITSFYQTLVAAATEASQVLVYNLAAVDSIYKDYDPSVKADLGQTINVPLPVSRTGLIYDAGVADITTNDVNAPLKPIVLNKHPMDAFVIRDFEQVNTPERLRNIFLDGGLKGMKESINAAVTGLFTVGNFPTNTAIATTTGIVTVSQFLAGKTVLGDQKVPILDVQNMTLLLASKPYNNMLDASSTAGAAWVQAQIAGNQLAGQVRSSGEMPVTFGATVKLDQQMPITGTAPTRTFTGAYFHKWAAALVTRKLPEPDGRVVDYTYIDFAGIPIRVQLGYNQLKNGYVITIDACYGLAVIRPEMCQLFTIAE